jgi:peptidoglycan/LPS O-acetylase OafA/YrhL
LTSTDDQYQAFQSTTFFSSLDGLRALSVVAVVWHHTAGVEHQPFNIVNRGYFGVDFFFAISGFLITTLLLRERRRTAGISLPRFYARRSLRIFPLYYAVLAVYVVLTFATRRGTPEGDGFFDHLPAFATYTSNWFVDLTAGTSVTFYFAWSLATEEQFYLFWPPILTFVSRRWTKPLVPAIVSLLVLITINQIALHAFDGDGFGLTVLQSLQLPILAGALGALLLDSRAAFTWIGPALASRAAAPVVAAAVGLELFVGARTELIQLSMVLLVLACCVRPTTALTPVLASRPLRHIGMVSYGVYLMHMLAANAVRPVVGRHSGVMVFLATLVVVLVMATMSYRWFESPLLRRKERFAAVAPSPAATHSTA